MPSKEKPLTEAQLRAYEAKRDLAAELLESVQQMKAGKTKVVHTPAVEARERTGLSQAQFADLLGVSVRTLQGWEALAGEPKQILPWMEHLLRVFGPQRLLWGSDWPVLELVGPYEAWWRLCREFTAELAPAEREAIFGGNARRVYRL